MQHVKHTKPNRPRGEFLLVFLEKPRNWDDLVSAGFYGDRLVSALHAIVDDKLGTVAFGPGGVRLLGVAPEGVAEHGRAA